MSENESQRPPRSRDSRKREQGTQFTLEASFTNDASDLLIDTRNNNTVSCVKEGRCPHHHAPAAISLINVILRCSIGDAAPVSLLIRATATATTTASSAHVAVTTTTTTVVVDDDYDDWHEESTDDGERLDNTILM